MSVDKVTKSDVEDALAYFKIKCDTEYLPADAVATKLYDELGNATDGAVNQATVTEELAKKIDSDTVTTALSKKADSDAVTAELVKKADSDKMTAELSKKLDSDATAAKATQLETARNIQTNLASTTAGSFNGTASVSAGVTGTLGIANGGTGQTTAAGVRNALGLGNTTGALPIANGGTGKNNLNDVTVGAANKDGAGNVITDTYVTKTAMTAELDKKLDVAAYVSLHNAKRYGYRISKTEADSAARVEYLYDAVGMTPAYMDFTAGQFNYGSWGDVWFVKDNKPLMLKYDGTVDYYLNPNDYTKKLDGTASDVANINYGGNAMAQMPLCWVYRYEDDNYYYEIVSNVMWDENYKAYAHVDADGVIKPYFYHSLFEGSGNATKIRSLSDQDLHSTITQPQLMAASKANGSGWNMGSWSQRSLITTLLVLIGKSTNGQAVFGNGLSNNSSHTAVNSGTLNAKGQFCGFNTNNQQIKTFHVEGLWGNMWKATAGVISYNGAIYIKMTPEDYGYQYNTVNGYTYIRSFSGTYLSVYLSRVLCSEYGLVPVEWSGSSSTFFCDCVAMGAKMVAFLSCGGCSAYDVEFIGPFCYSYANVTNASDYHTTCHLAYV